MEHREHPHKECDVVIVGGGIAALGVARALLHTGLRVVLLEKRSLGSATSANSLRIMHGGFRYLQSLNVSRCIRSIAEQVRLRREFPEIIQPLPCVLPLKPGTLRSALPLTLASLFYSTCYSLVQGSPVCSGQVHRKNAGRQFDALPGYAPHGLFRWDDMQLTDPERLVEILREQLEAGKVAIGEGIEFIRGEASENGWSITVNDSGATGTIAASVIVNAAGPWVEDICERINQPSPFQPLSWARALNLVIDREIEPNYGVAFDSKGAGLLFMTARGSKTVIGTFYSPYKDSAEVLTPDAESIMRIVAKINRSLPMLKIKIEEVEAVEYGLLPVKENDGGVPVLYGSEKITTVGRCVHLLSTKYTTFLGQGERVARKVHSLL